MGNEAGGNDIRDGGDRRGSEDWRRERAEALGLVDTGPWLGRPARPPAPPRKQPLPWPPPPAAPAMATAPPLPHVDSRETRTHQHNVQDHRFDRRWWMLVIIVGMGAAALLGWWLGAPPLPPAAQRTALPAPRLDRLAPRVAPPRIEQARPAPASPVAPERAPFAVPVPAPPAASIPELRRDQTPRRRASPPSPAAARATPVLRIKPAKAAPALPADPQSPKQSSLSQIEPTSAADAAPSEVTTTAPADTVSEPPVAANSPSSRSRWREAPVHSSIIRQPGSASLPRRRSQTAKTD